MNQIPTTTWLQGTLVRSVRRGRTRLGRGQKLPIHYAAPRYAKNGALRRPAGYYARIDLPQPKQAKEQGRAMPNRTILAFLYLDEVDAIDFATQESYPASANSTAYAE